MKQNSTASVGVVHDTLRDKGGAERVCMCVLEALQNDYDVTLYTPDEPHLGELNEHFDTSVNNIETHSYLSDDSTVNRILTSGVRTVESVPKDWRQLRLALLNRLSKRQLHDHDIVVHTKFEYCVSHPSIIYLHIPRMGWANYVCERTRTWSCLRWRLIETISSSIAGFSTSKFIEQHVVTNSRWTASVIEEVHGFKPNVVYPPVIRRERFDDVPPLTSREAGFVMVGRITPDKHVLEIIEVLDRLRDAGYDVHLHVVGPTDDRMASDYAKHVRQTAANREYVFFEGVVTRERVWNLLRSHRYGIHGKENEHFGISIAEMVAAGMVPFVPDNGGQREIVGERTELLYESFEDAHKKIIRVLNDKSKRRELRKSLPNARDHYSVGRFEERIREIVESRLHSNATV